MGADSKIPTSTLLVSLFFAGHFPFIRFHHLTVMRHCHVFCLYVSMKDYYVSVLFKTSYCIEKYNVCRDLRVFAIFFCGSIKFILKSDKHIVLTQAITLWFKLI